MKKRIFSIMDISKKKTGIALLCTTSILTIGTGIVFAANTKSTTMQMANTPMTKQQQEQSNNQIEQDSKNQYAIYEQYGLTYNANEDKMYYKDKIVRYFIDRYNNGQGVLSMWGYDLDGTIDIYAVRDNVGLQGNLIGIELYSQEDFDLRTKEIEAQQNNIPDYNIKTFRFRKDEAPDSLKLWIRQCEDDVSDFIATHQNGRYYVYVSGETEFGFSINVDGDEASMKIYDINGVKGDGYALFSIPLYKSFSVTYNEAHKGFLQD